MTTEADLERDRRVWRCQRALDATISGSQDNSLTIQDWVMALHAVELGLIRDFIRETEGTKR